MASMGTWHIFELAAAKWMRRTLIGMGSRLAHGEHGLCLRA
jgi:hypothetical protein